MDVDELAGYLTDAQALVFVGAGASAELGLLSWPALVDRVISAAKEAGRLTESREKDARHAASNGNLAAAMRTVEKAAGRDFLLSLLGELTADNGVQGNIYLFAAHHAFRGYLTTNYDGAMARHLLADHPRTEVRGNSRLDISKVEFDAHRTVVYLHGRLPENGDRLVITTEDYDELEAAPDFEYLRQFLRAHLMGRVLFLGYSLKDPDLQSILRQLKQVLGRSTPLVALLPDVSPSDQEDYWHRFNVQVISYRNPDGTHRELTHFLTQLRFLLPRRNEVPAPRFVEFNAADRALYVWVQSQLVPGINVSAIKSVLLTSIEDGRSRESLFATARTFVGLGDQAAEALFTQALQELLESGLVSTADGVVTLSTAGTELLQKTAEGRNRARASFDVELRRVVREELKGYSDEVQRDVQGVILECIIDAFEQVGLDVAQAVLVEGVLDRAAARSLFRVVHARAETAEPDSIRHYVASLALRLLLETPPPCEDFVEEVARAYFAAAVLDTDKTGFAARKEIVQDYTLIFDANVLIPLLASGVRLHQSMVGLIEGARAAGYQLATTDAFVEQTVEHARWARAHVRRFGSRGTEMLEAAMGWGRYDRNQFIRGYIRTRALGTFESYLTECFASARIVDEVAAQLLHDRWGMRIIHPSDLGDARVRYYEVAAQLASEAEIRRSEPSAPPDKRRDRATSEAETCALVLVMNERVGGARHFVVSYGNFIDELARSVGSPSIVIEPRDLASKLLRLGEAPSAQLSMRELLLSNYFANYGQLADSAALQQFFQPLIRAGHDALTESRALFEQSLGPGSTEEILRSAELLSPFAVEEAVRRLGEEVTEQRAHVRRLQEQLGQVAVDREKERKELSELRREQDARRLRRGKPPAPETRRQRKLKGKKPRRPNRP